MNKTGSSHLTRDERKLIERLLNDGLSCKDIAGSINKDPRSISREVKKRRDRKENKKHAWNFGLYKKNNPDKIKPCKTINRFPYVCNACPGSKRSGCKQQYKYFYDTDLAEENYRIILSDSRVGLDISPEDKIRCDSILIDGIRKGQSIHHIVTTHKSDIPYSERTIYRLVDKNQTTVQAIDLRRKVKLKPRKHYTCREDNKAIREGRKYADFIKYISNEPFISIAELDTVESTNEGRHKCLLTIHSTITHFMMIFVLDYKSKENVGNVLHGLQKKYGHNDFKKFFKISLTDRGTEFCDPLALELDFETGEQIAHMFYCNSYASYQKGAIEENHTLLRYVIPKGTVFDHLTQNQANTIASHINSFYRKSIDGCPYDLAKEFYGDDFIKKTEIRKIDPDLVTLNSSLLH